MTSRGSMVTWILLMTVVALTSASYDHSVCTPATPTVPIAMPAALNEVWQTVIEWNDDVKNRTYIVRDYGDMPNKKEKLVISIPLEDDITVLYDWNTHDVTVEETVRGSSPEKRQCRVVEHSNSGDIFSYRNIFWLTSLFELTRKFISSRDAILTGSVLVRGIRAQKWSACVSDPYKNITVLANLYLSDATWLSPYFPPNSGVPVRLEYLGRQHDGSDVTDISLVGDIISFKKREPFDKFSPDTFTTQAGAFCPGRTGMSLRFPGFPSRLSLMMEVVDTDFTHVSYQQLWYDSVLQKARWDFKPTASLQDSDTTSYLMDFRSGIRYNLDRYLMTCSDYPLSNGDDFTTSLANGTLTMMSTMDYFHAGKANIQYVGQVTIRNVVCNTWIGRYFDSDASRNETVQWYFTTRKWVEATGNVEGGEAFFMMKVWKGGSGNPIIYNILKYSPAAPDFTVFDFSPCYGFNAKKHFTIEFAVSNTNELGQVNQPYLKLFLVQKLAARLMIDPNRFTDVTLDLNSAGGTLFMSASLLGALRGNQRHEVSLDGAFVFLRGSIDASHLALNLNFQNLHIRLTGISLVEHNFRKEFATTTPTPPPTPPPTTKIVAPTLVPPKKPTTIHPPTTTTITTTTTKQGQQSTSACPPPTTNKPCTCPSIGPTNCPKPRVCPVCPTTSSHTSPPYPPTPCPPSSSTPTPSQCSPARVCPTVCSCGARGGQRTKVTCPPPQPCSTGKSSCQCAGTTSSKTDAEKQTSSSSDVHISSGGLAGAVLAALLLGLAVGVVATRLYHLTRDNRESMTINLIEDI